MRQPRLLKREALELQNLPLRNPNPQRPNQNLLLKSRRSPQKKLPPAQKKEPAIADKKLQKSSKPLAPKEKKTDNRAKISDQLKKDLAESIAKIEGKKQSAPAAQRSHSQALAPIRLQIDTSSNADSDADYPNLMIGYLHQSLHLPEFGEVKIQLTLHQDGHVVKLVVLNAESDKNKRYLEGNLSHLRFPSFSGSLAQKKEHTFILTFCNEI